MRLKTSLLIYYLTLREQRCHACCVRGLLVGDKRGKKSATPAVSGLVGEMNVSGGVRNERVSEGL